MELVGKIIRLSEKLGAEYADVRVERMYSTDIRLTQDTFDQVASGVDQGFGVRVLYDGVWGFGSSTSLKPSDISKAVRGAIKAAKATALYTKERTQLAEAPRVKRTVATEAKIPMQSVSMNEKMKLTFDTSRAAKTDRRVASMMCR